MKLNRGGDEQVREAKEQERGEGMGGRNEESGIFTVGD